jgi:hypothetical protein
MLALGVDGGASDLAGAGESAIEEVGEDTFVDEAALEGAGRGVWLDGAGTGVTAGVELGLGVTVVEGS